MRHVPIVEFKDRLSELVAAAARGEEIIITRHGKVEAKLGPANDQEHKRRVEAAIGRIREHQQRMRARGMTSTAQERRMWRDEGRP